MPAPLPGLLRLRRRASRRRRHAAAGHRLQRPGADRPLPRASSTSDNPIHVSIVGGEPLVRFRELERDPAHARRARHLHAGRDQRGAADSRPNGRRSRGCRSSSRSTACSRNTTCGARPATYDRILKHIAGHQITVHCTVTRQQVQRDGYLEEFAALLVGEPRTCGRSGSASTRRRSAKSPTRSLTPRGSRARRRGADGAAPALSRSSQMPEGLIEVYASRRRPRTSASSRRRRPASRRTSSADHAVPVRRQSRLLAAAAASPRPVSARSAAHRLPGRPARRRDLRRLARASAEAMRSRAARRSA